MNDFELNRRQALVASGLGLLTLGMPGIVMGSDKVDASGKAVPLGQIVHLCPALRGPQSR